MHRHMALLVLLLGVTVTAPGGQASSPSGPVGPVRSQAFGSPRIHLEPAREIAAKFAGPGRAVKALRAGRVVPLSLASADFDEDGVPDVLSGFKFERGGLIALHRGNVDAIHPNAPEARERMRNGMFTDAAFLPDTRVIETPDPPDFLGAGDFDADGHWDVVTASRARARLLWHRGDGKGGFGPSQAVEVPGKPTAFVTGEINRRDGLEDVVVAVDGLAGPEALVFEAPEGALQRPPERFGLPAPATSLVLEQMDAQLDRDLLIASGQTLVFIEGRDRLLSVTEPGRTGCSPAALTRVVLPFRVTSLELGRFQATDELDVAVLSESGAVHAAPLASILAMAGSVRSAEDALGPPLKLNTPGARLLRSKISIAPGDDLLVLPAGGPVQLLPPARTAAPSWSTQVPEARHSFTDRRPVPLPASQGDPVAMLRMRLNADGRQDLVLLSSNSNAPSAYTTLDAATFTVTNVSDSGPGSLRQAILDANATLDSDLIEFSIGGSGPYVIQPTTPLPEITAPVTIDGTTQPGFVLTPLVTLDGALLTSCCVRFGLNDRGGGGNTFKGLRLINFADAAIHVGREAGDFGDWHIEGNHIGFDAEGDAAPNHVGIDYNSSGSLAGSIFIGGTTEAARNVISGNTFGIANGSECEVFEDICLRRLIVQGNYVGTWPGGTVVVPGSYGVTSKTPEALIGGTVAGAGNVISGLSADALTLDYVSDSLRDHRSLVQGNFIGTAPGGLIQLGNRRAVAVATHGNTIGGTTPAARNILASDVPGRSLVIGWGAGFNQVQGNFIGLAADGRTPFLGEFGVSIEGPSNVIGGTTPGARNVISGHSEAGVSMGTDAELNTIAGNYIGTNASGNAAVPNHRGVDLFSEAINNVIGQPSGRNVISGNIAYGVLLRSTGANVVANNLIGLNADGTEPLGNFQGVSIESSDGNLIGGTSVEFQNIIAYNAASGIRVVAGTGNALLINAIFDNLGQGIDLHPVGPNEIDPGDPDEGPNHLQNFPVVTLAQWNGETVRVDGTLDSLPLSDFTIRVYANESCDPSGHGEGKFYLGSFIVSTDAIGMATFSETLAAATAIGEVVTATASHLGNTSEFSACKSVVGVAPGVVDDVRFDSATPENLVWDAEPGASLYHVYVGTVPTMPGLVSPTSDSCEAVGLPQTGGTLPPGSNPPTGHMIWFLVTAENQFGEGGLQPASSGPRQLNSTGPCSDSCAHSTCSTGGPLDPACTLCTGIICAKDPHCCDPQNGSWDFACVQQMRTVCRSLTCPESEGQCAHALCDNNGGPLTPGCDSPPLAVSCTAAVCQAEPHCCQQVWDEACIERMETLCGYSCI